MNKFYAIVLLMVGLAGAQVIEFSQSDWHCGDGTLGPVDSWSDAQSRLWDGLDKTNTPARPGVYLYIIDKNGEVVCEGTIVLTR